LPADIPKQQKEIPGIEPIHHPLELLFPLSFSFSPFLASGGNNHVMICAGNKGFGLIDASQRR
jgi:hypothetical protein